jgi:hypothetical protein
VVTAVDGHSRYCVIANVVEHATGRAVCLALAEALARFGVPEEVNTDNRRQFTGRSGRHGTRNGEVLFDRICRRNGIAHRLTAPASPNQNGKAERFHGTFRPDVLDIDRPRQALDQKVPGTPAGRFDPVPAAQRGLVDLWLPDALEGADTPAPEPVQPGVGSSAAAEALPVPVRPAPEGGPVEFDRVRSAVRQPPGRREAVLARPRPDRDGDPFLGRLRSGPPVRGRHADQDPALPPVPGRPDQARRQRRRPRPAVPAAAARRRHSGGRGGAGLPHRPVSLGRHRLPAAEIEVFPARDIDILIREITSVRENIFLSKTRSRNVWARIPVTVQTR